MAGFELESDARRFLAALEKRLARFHLRLHAEKTRLLEFGRGSEATFTCLGFCHYWAKSLAGHWVVKRRTARERVARFIRNVREWCRANRHARTTACARTCERWSESERPCGFSGASGCVVGVSPHEWAGIDGTSA